MPEASRKNFQLSGGSRLSYLTAGEGNSQAVLLLHGFPQSAGAFAKVIPELARSSHVIAPDLPGFGMSEPLSSTSFTAFTQAISELLEHLEIGPRYIYVHDFGAPVALQIAMNDPEKVLGLIIQNANAHTTGQGPGWEGTKEFWADPNPENEAEATQHLTLEGTRDQYIADVPEEVAEQMSSESWEADWRVMQLPGRMETQKALIQDYGNYVKSFDAISDYLAEWQPPALMLWGRHDSFFDLAEVQSWMKDLPRMEAHILDAAHLLLETHSSQAASFMVDFIGRSNESAR